MLIQISLIGGFCLALWITWKRLAQRAISRGEWILWSALWVGGVLIVSVPTITERIAAFIGVGRGVDAVLYAAVALQFYLIFTLIVEHERLKRRMSELVEKLALGTTSPDRTTSPSHAVGYSSSMEEESRVLSVKAPLSKAKLSLAHGESKGD